MIVSISLGISCFFVVYIHPCITRSKKLIAFNLLYFFMLQLQHYFYSIPYYFHFHQGIPLYGLALARDGRNISIELSQAVSWRFFLQRHYASRLAILLLSSFPHHSPSPLFLPLAQSSVLWTQDELRLPHHDHTRLPTDKFLTVCHGLHSCYNTMVTTVSLHTPSYISDKVQIIMSIVLIRMAISFDSNLNFFWFTNSRSFYISDL